MRLNETAKAALREPGVSPSVWARANFMADGKWAGDACGCPDDRCIGFHHLADEDCGCLQTRLADFLTCRSDAIRATFAEGVLRPIRRLNGKPYRPRKLTAYPVGDEDETTVGVVVFGTHDPARAQELADAIAHREGGSSCFATQPECVWWVDTFAGGRRTWVTDEDHGRAGVWFRDIEEAAFNG